MIRTGFENFDISSSYEPTWMKDERYGYCEDFYELCEKNNQDLAKKLVKLPMILMTMLFH